MQSWNQIYPLINDKLVYFDSPGWALFNVKPGAQKKADDLIRKRFGQDTLKSLRQVIRSVKGIMGLFGLTATACETDVIKTYVIACCLLSDQQAAKENRRESTHIFSICDACDGAGGRDIEYGPTVIGNFAISAGVGRYECNKCRCRGYKIKKVAKCRAT